MSISDNSVDMLDTSVIISDNSVDMLDTSVIISDNSVDMLDTSDYFWQFCRYVGHQCDYLNIYVIILANLANCFNLQNEIFGLHKCRKKPKVK